MDVIGSKSKVGTVFCCIFNEFIVDFVEKCRVGVLSAIDIENLGFKLVIKVLGVDDLPWRVVDNFELHHLRFLFLDKLNFFLLYLR